MVEVREQLLAGNYQPKPVREQEIPKSDGGVRKLGIPTVLDRLIQQAIHQVIGPRVDPTFSKHSHGFRPGHSAHDAVREAQQYIQSGKQWVVDVDIKQFFDCVSHDVLMGRLAKHIGDKRMLRLIRRYLEAEVMAKGVVTARKEGTPQGGPLSPLLANVLLDEVDKELEKRGHCFVRYADDCNVYVGSQRAGEDVMELLQRLYGRLGLQINEAKSAVARSTTRKFLGYSFWYFRGLVRPCVAQKALGAMKEKVRAITRRSGGRSMEAVVGELHKYLPGWRRYFRLAESPSVFRKLDEWLRRRLRQLQLKHWKRGTTAYRELRRRGVPEELAIAASAQARRWWRSANSFLKYALPNKHFDELGVPRFANQTSTV